MSAKKFERLIDLIINEDQQKAEQLFHDIVVEKSRQIYESLINEDQSMGFLDEIEDENAGMDGMMEDDESDFEADEEISGDYDVEGDDGEFDDEDEVEFDDEDEEFDDEDEESEEGDEPVTKDDILNLEDKLDSLIAQFEAEMGGDEVEIDSAEVDGDEDEVMESVELKKVSVTHGDNGDQTKSPGLQNPKRVGTGGAPVKFADGSETVPTSPKAPSNAYAKGQKEEDFGNINKVGGDASKGAKAPAAVKTQASGVNTKSPVSESRKTRSRI
jgi:hypothetical protein